MTSPIRPINVNLANLAQRRLTVPKPGQTPHQSPADHLDLSAASLAAQRELDSIKAQIGNLADNRGQSNSGYRVEDVYSGLARARVGNVHFNQGQFEDINVEVTASAQKAGLYLSFGGRALDFNTGSAFTLNIAGVLGSRELTFTSGTTLTNMAAAINTFSPATGVVAEATETGLNLRVPGYGSREFVSVRNTGDAFLAGETGVYSFMDRDANTIDTASQVSWSSAANPVVDHGQDVHAVINSHTVTGNGTGLIYTDPFLTAQLDLKLGNLGQGETANAEHLGAFLAFRVRWDGDTVNPLSESPPGIDVSG